MMKPETMALWHHAQHDTDSSSWLNIVEPFVAFALVMVVLRVGIMFIVYFSNTSERDAFDEDSTAMIPQYTGKPAISGYDELSDDDLMERNTLFKKR
jgi:hypothetical protein